MICSNNGSTYRWSCYVKSDRERQIACSITYTWNLIKMIKKNLKKTNKLTDFKTKLTITIEETVGGGGELPFETQTRKKRFCDLTILFIQSSVHDPIRWKIQPHYTWRNTPASFKVTWYMYYRINQIYIYTNTHTHTQTHTHRRAGARAQVRVRSLF